MYPSPVPRDSGPSKSQLTTSPFGVTTRPFAPRLSQYVTISGLHGMHLPLLVLIHRISAPHPRHLLFPITFSNLQLLVPLIFLLDRDNFCIPIPLQVDGQVLFNAQGLSGPSVYPNRDNQDLCASSWLCELSSANVYANDIPRWCAEHPYMDIAFDSRKILFRAFFALIPTTTIIAVMLAGPR